MVLVTGGGGRVPPFFVCKDINKCKNRELLVKDFIGFGVFFAGKEHLFPSKRIFAVKNSSKKSKSVLRVRIYK